MQNLPNIEPSSPNPRQNHRRHTKHTRRPPNSPHRYRTHAGSSVPPANINRSENNLSHFASRAASDTLISRATPPSANTTIRVQNRSAKFRSCVTATHNRPASASARSKEKHSSCCAISKNVEGSSSSKTSASCARQAASSTRCRSPPLNVATPRDRHPQHPVRSIAVLISR